MTKEELMQLSIRKPKEEARRIVQENWDALAKPLDGMGAFEAFFAKIGAMTGNPSVSIQKKAVLVLCADNGIVEEQISQSGQEVTASVAAALGCGTSSVCRMAKKVGAKVIPVDIGIATAEQIKGVLPKKIAYGTKNFLKEPAMSETETLAAIETGILLVKKYSELGYELLATGEMGIGNTTTSSAMAAAMLSLSAKETTGKGAGLSDTGLLHKKEVIKAALEIYHFEKEETFRILQTVGGLDIAGLCGVFLGGARYGVPIVVDGVISTVAALAAERLVPGTKEFMLPSHKSREPAAMHMLEELALSPVLDANLALGEGTGAVMFMGLLDIAGTLYQERTTFADICVAPYTRFEK